MKTLTVNPRESPEALIALLAKHGHTTVQEIYETFADCVLCQRRATIAIISVERNTWFRKIRSGKLCVLTYGLCQQCFDSPVGLQNAAAVLCGRCSESVH
jgi:hypothetical protein